MRIPLSFLFILVALLLTVSRGFAQDTIVLLNGKIIHANVMHIEESTIKYMDDKCVQSKVHSIKSVKVFAVNKRDGSEQIVFKKDPLDTAEFSVSQLRLFIKGEQAARAGYRNGVNEVCAFLVGVGSSYFSIYGLVGPPLYTSIVGSFSPDVRKQKNVDPNLVNFQEYEEGYQTVVRNKKIKNSFIAGMAGFVVGFTAQTIIASNNKK